MGWQGYIGKFFLINNNPYADKLYDAVNTAGKAPTPPPSGNFLLQENGSFLLQENSSKIELL
jgi:hypothetical protein